MTTLLMIAALLLTTVAVVAVGERIGLPWPALLTIVTAGAFLVPGIPELEIPSELILPVFLPPLLWALARRTSWPVIRGQLSTIVSLSVLLVFATIAVLTGVTLLLLPGIGVAAAIVLAAALAPPDPVAVDAVAEPVGIPRRIITSLQSEGLFNDAASIVTFHVALGALVAGSELSWTAGVLSFLWSVIAAVALGLLSGRLSAWFTDHVPSVEASNALTWVLPFAIYLLAEEVGASGVIAIVIAAVEMNSRASIGAEDRLSGGAFWGTVEILFTGVAFGLIGLSVRDAVEEVGSDLWAAVGVGVVLSLAAIAVRFLWLWGSYRINRWRGRTNTAPLRMQEALLMSWAGMRGLVTLALVLSIPSGFFPFHHELAVIALVVLLITMVLPALTLPWLMGRLNLEQGPDAAGDQARAELVERVRRAARAHLEEHPEVPTERIDAIRQWISRELGDDTEAAGRFAEQRRAAGKLRLGALRAAQEELIAARREPGVNPAYVDEVLGTVDRMILAAER
ncbi:cation:proton antiporter [Corynebacterium halotolerans]|uniref:NhaP-type Na+/H+ and K+/H+ antiporter n=1 Tax=Corynebacterium halotolerans YIM 70093 = DSM 44683 TaxID=1121362 RepID=M1P884_9CORY|nr:sodium:proton antiporter [Corynebacterium halotolerans]AGF72881.1 NhaP-type Na+/H+ and K+/H+ antiporter [Corynebacterium halotolerans YIM 70093 = DSM 44683]